MKELDKKTQYNLQYAKDKLKRVPLDLPKEYYSEIQAHAQGRNETVNGFIKRAISETMERDAASTPPRGDMADGGARDNPPE